MKERHEQLRAETQRMLDDNPHDIQDILEQWDPDWRAHYVNDEFLALRNAMEYGMPEFHAVVKEYLE